MGINVLSLFDGMSCGRIALDRAKIDVDNYYASEIDAPAITVTGKNWPCTMQLGNVTMWKDWDLDWSGIDLLIAGSPCQGFSMAGKMLAFDDPRSKLFFRFVDILEHIKKRNPNVKFMLENVRMKPAHMDVISDMVGVKPLMINSDLVSAQSRKRFYWSNWPISTPVDRNISLIDILEPDLPSDHIGMAVRKKSKCLRVGGRYSPLGDRHEWDSPFQRVAKNGTPKPSKTKAGCLTGGANSGENHSDMDILHSPYATRRYTVKECERLQTVPDGYTEGVSNTQRYKMLGNGWTVDIIAHLFSEIPTDLAERSE
tara:strand:- start:222 stop:1160 length:939 start_codon:yes stop_codon:yes gene_type:complete